MIWKGLKFWYDSYGLRLGKPSQGQKSDNAVPNNFRFCVGKDRCVLKKKTRLFFIAPACSRVRYRRPIFCPSVRPSVRPSTFMSTFDIYVKVSILINYKTKQPSNLAWNISLTSWLCDIGICFSICLSICPSVCQHLCRSSTFMSKLVF